MSEIRWDVDLTTEVRSLSLDDAPALFSLVEANRDRLRLWMPWERTTRDPDDIRDFIARSRASAHDIEANGIFVDGALVGTIGLSINPLNNAGEIGYWIDRNFEGRGIVTEGCRLFIEHGFGSLGLHRISLHAGVDNVRSRAVAERLGFTHEGVLREADRVGDDRYVDLAVYSLLEAEWSDG